MPERPRVALATCAELPDGDADDARLPEALGARFVVWDDPDAGWEGYDLVVIRSAWDYHDRRDEFLAWTRLVGDRLINPPGVVAWNTDKRYLAELPHAVPTTILEPGASLPEFDREIVVKPTVSAGSRLTGRFLPDERGRAAALLQRIHVAGKAAIVQPYLASVDERGETALMFFGGEFSHAIRKGPILRPGAEPTDELYAAEEVEPREPTPEEMRVATDVLAAVGPALPYARVDLVQDAGGRPLLLELELTEPSLFFAQCPTGVAPFARVVQDLLHSR